MNLIERLRNRPAQSGHPLSDSASRLAKDERQYVFWLNDSLMKLSDYAHEMDRAIFQLVGNGTVRNSHGMLAADEAMSQFANGFSSIYRLYEASEGRAVPSRLTILTDWDHRGYTRLLGDYLTLASTLFQLMGEQNATAALKCFKEIRALQIHCLVLHNTVMDACVSCLPEGPRPASRRDLDDVSTGLNRQMEALQAKRGNTRHEEKSTT